MNWNLILIAAVILVFAGYSALKPTYRRFRANRAREQKQPEKYHLT